MLFMVFMLDNQISHHPTHPGIYMTRSSYVPFFLQSPLIHSMVARLISKMLFLCSWVLGSFSPIWCLGLWWCIKHVERKQTGEIRETLLWSTCRILSCVWRFSSRHHRDVAFHHTPSHIASSSSCVSVWSLGHALQHAGMSARLSCALNRMEKTADWEKESGTESNRWWGNT